MDDKKHGEGVYIYNDGSSYDGEWMDNKYHGNGVKYNKDGSIIYKGIWNNGIPLT